tara:strand:+ start:3503 stop:3718 length:216 start_codon:yes stop_codon:yes gene_type:complete
MAISTEDRIYKRLSNEKMDKMKVKHGPPMPSEGEEGELTVRSTNVGLRLYVKHKSKWHGVTLGDEGIEVIF